MPGSEFLSTTLTKPLKTEQPSTRAGLLERGGSRVEVGGHHPGGHGHGAADVDDRQADEAVRQSIFAKSMKSGMTKVLT
jgi:hypothetical protein